MIFINKESRFLSFFYNIQAWHNKFFVYNFFISFTLLLIIWGEMIWAFFAIKTASFLSLHYSIYFGVDWIGTTWGLFFFSITATIFFLINYLLSGILYNKKRELSYFLIASLTLLELFMLASISLIIYINWGSSVSAI